MAAHHIEAGADALVMDARDHVATAIKDLQQGQKVSYRKQDQVHEIVLVDAIPFGHKLAIEDIPQGTDIRKYGEVIGRTTADIKAGQHVHIHNVEGIRGRGDQAVKA
ncbi:UxaA family hydrolase [Paenibacillus doosanensis]|uniref:Altronate dehydratase n=1 Tax=Paenibacillus konkukensis TaxID=2020716 RepID=A0ABY4RLZ4_9BACL|nr:MULTISPECIES: UxaA family hydrolase [Paenibacillus]MCS7462384.1 UxaA family hydrolase [Paenibacillus doosanensis]UQZ83235.1 Altronate dehydratase [Paenibacillus konkukensis]